MNLFNINHKKIGLSGLFALLFLLSACAAQETKPDASPAAEAEPVAAQETTAQAPAPEPKKKATKPKQAAAKQKPGKPLPKALSPDNPASAIYLGSDGKLAGRGTMDKPASEVVRIARGAHPQALSLPGLPKDKLGLIDWSKLLDKKVIQPADTLKGGPAVPPFELDVIIKAKGLVKDVIFPHAAHTYWLDCNNCHTSIFVMAKGQNKMTMQEIVEGKWCGRCHGKVSFPLIDCNRCHNIAK